MFENFELKATQTIHGVVLRWNMVSTGERVRLTEGLSWIGGIVDSRRAVGTMWIHRSGEGFGATLGVIRHLCANRNMGQIRDSSPGCEDKRSERNLNL